MLVIEVIALKLLPTTARSAVSLAVAVMAPIVFPLKVEPVIAVRPFEPVIEPATSPTVPLFAVTATVFMPLPAIAPAVFDATVNVALPVTPLALPTPVPFPTVTVIGFKPMAFDWRYCRRRWRRPCL